MAEKIKSSFDITLCIAIILCLILDNVAVQCSDVVDMPLDADVFALPPGKNAPQQVHITQGDHDGRGVTVSWTTPHAPGSNIMFYWKDNTTDKQTCESSVQQYTYSTYTSGFIHHCLIENLDFDTKYFYMVGNGNAARTFSFTTPPKPGPDVPYTFGLIGDLGQSFDSNSTVAHYLENPLKGQALLYLGDLSYADQYPNHDNVRWDTWGRFTERSAAFQPWIWTAGNHELDFEPSIGETEPFKPFSNRYPTPFKASGSTSQFWYSIKRGPAYIIVLSSYSAYGKYSPQYNWLTQELTKVNREETPWLIVLVHSPWYNSYVSHYMEGETMRVMYESFLVENKVDVVFSGHVHAYERCNRISNIKYNISNGQCTPVKDLSAPMYITIGDGGNLEGLSKEMKQPQPSYSAFREASFGHGTLYIRNRTHAHFSWHRNQDGATVEADSLWLHNRVFQPDDESSLGMSMGGIWVG